MEKRMNVEWKENKKKKIRFQNTMWRQIDCAKINI